MTPGVLTDAAEKNLERQMGCMAGFFQLFDRHQILNGKRVYSAKRLPSSSPCTTSPSPSERSDASPTSVCSSVKEAIPTSPPPPMPQLRQAAHSPEPTTPAKPAVAPAPATPNHTRQQTLPLPVFSSANSTANGTSTTAWKLREAPRLSLDSRIFDGKPTRIFPREIRTSTSAAQQHPDADVHDRQRRSPSVVARLMGLDNLLAAKDSDPAPNNEAVQGFNGATTARAPELRRSASESRASRDLLLPPYSFQAEINSRGGWEEQHRRSDSQQQQQQHGHSMIPNTTPYFDPITAKFVTDKGVASQKPPLPPSASHNINNSATGTGTINQQSVHPPPFPLLHRKSFFDAHDIFPEPAKLGRSGSGCATGLGSSAASSMYGEIEKRLRMRGIDEPAKDLETLKQILEALQLKGLLHQTRRQRNASNVDSGRNLVYDNTPNPPLILMKPICSGGTGPRSSPSPSPRRRDPPGTPPSSSSRLGGASPRRTAGAADARSRRDRVAMERGTNLGNAVERRGRGNGLRSASDLTPADVRSPRSPATAARRQHTNSPSESRRSSPAQSPRLSTTGATSGPRRPSPDPTGRSPRTRRPAPAATDFTPGKDAARLSDESSTVSESSYSTISQLDFEKVKIEEYREGRNLLERCDKLLNSIAELTDLGGAGASSRSMEIQQPSPVSILDASAAFYCDDTTTSATASTAGSPPSPSPAASKRCLDFFKDAAEEKPLQRGPCWAPMDLHAVDDVEAGDGDFLYVAEVLCAAAGPSGAVDDDVFYFLEKRRQQQHQQQCGGDQSMRQLHRRLVFDTVVEIVDKKRQLSTWEEFTRSQQSPAAAAAAGGGGRAVWEEVKQIRQCGEPAVAEDLFEAVCGVLKKDMAMDSREAQGWGNRSLEMSEVVLDVERLIFKDLVAETIRDLAAASVGTPLSSSSSSSSSSTSCSNSGYNNCRSSSSAAALGLPRRKLVF